MLKRSDGNENRESRWNCAHLKRKNGSTDIKKGQPQKFIKSLKYTLGKQNESTVKPQFTGPLGEKELGPVNREARYIGVHFTLIYT